MVSATAHTSRRRAIRKARAGRDSRKLKAQNGTPSFPLHPVGYDANAADAKPAK